MDIMLLGETVESDTNNTLHYGFWMPAGGNDGVAAVEVFRVSASDIYTVSLQTKSSDETDPISTVGIIGSASIDSTSPGVFKFDVSDAKDLVRYQLEYASDSGAGAIHLQFAQPLWAPN